MSKLEENPRTDRITVECYNANFLPCYCIKQIDSILPCLFSAVDHRRRQNVVKTCSDQLACDSLVFLSHFDVIFDLRLRRPTAKWSLSVKVQFSRDRDMSYKK